MEGIVYHIQNPDNTGLDHGYVGVVNANKGVYSRYKEHSNSKYMVGYCIRHMRLQYDDHVKILFRGSLEECYDYEKKLRPMQNMGWNLAAGGGGPYQTTINLKEHRSHIQTQRMKDESIKKKQSNSFKENYYKNIESQKLRSLRAKEHMADLDKKQKCLNALHKLIKCEHCDFRSNVGNVKQHVKRVHSDN